MREKERPTKELLEEMSQHGLSFEETLEPQIPAKTGDNSSGRKPSVSNINAKKEKLMEGQAAAQGHSHEKATLTFDPHLLEAVGRKMENLAAMNTWQNRVINGAITAGITLAVGGAILGVYRFATGGQEEMLPAVKK